VPITTDQLQYLRGEHITSEEDALSKDEQVRIIVDELNREFKSPCGAIDGGYSKSAYMEANERKRFCFCCKGEIEKPQENAASGMFFLEDGYGIGRTWVLKRTNFELIPATSYAFISICRICHFQHYVRFKEEMEALFWSSFFT